MYFMLSKELPNSDELLFPEKPKEGHHIPTNEDYERAKKQALKKGGVGVLEVNDDDIPIEVTVLVRDKHGLVRLFCQPSLNPNKVYELNRSPDCLYYETEPEWNKSMLTEDVRKKLNETLAEVFDKYRT
jgi:hypothetical protein